MFSRQRWSSLVVFLVLFLAVVVVPRPARCRDDEDDARADGGGVNRGGRRASEKRPNFVVLFVDDLGYGDVGFTGHPTTRTPNMDRLAKEGKILTSWYSACSICSGSRASLMTGRQFPRYGVPGVFHPTERGGLPLKEVTIAQYLKEKAGYVTGMTGKWHLGQREVYLPANRGFDYYLGIPYSIDMGDARATACDDDGGGEDIGEKEEEGEEDPSPPSWKSYESYYKAHGMMTAASDDDDDEADDDPAGRHVPLVYQTPNTTRVVEQPLDLTRLAEKYNRFATDFIRAHRDRPFFLYVPFSHVHTTSPSRPDKQYAGCDFQNSTVRGPFGDALAEADWIVGNIADELRKNDLEEDTLVLFTSDNGPWLIQQLSGGSAGLLTGRYAGYWNTGKGSTWEGGIRMPAFAYWKGRIEPFTRSSEVVSSMDVFPTLARLAGLDVPSDRVYDGRDMTPILFRRNGTSEHDFLFFYGTCHLNSDHPWTVAAVRHGRYKAHWCTGPGDGTDPRKNNATKEYHPYPLLFDVDRDPAEANPISTGEWPEDPEHRRAMKRIVYAYAFEKSTFVYGPLDIEPDRPGEGPGTYGVCCDRSRSCYCDGDDAKSRQERAGGTGLFNVGTKSHHDYYHDILGEDEPSPPRTEMQRRLQRVV